MSKPRRRGCTPADLARQAPDAEKAAAKVPSARHGPASQRRPEPSRVRSAHSLAALVEDGEPCTVLSLTASYGDSEANPAQAVGECLGTRPCTAASEARQRATGRTSLDDAVPTSVPTSCQYAPRCVQCSPRGSVHAPPRRIGAARQAGAGRYCSDKQSDRIYECQTDTNDCTAFRKFCIHDTLFKMFPIVLSKSKLRRSSAPLFKRT